MIRERGQFDNSRYWEIDMNNAHQLYLCTYSRIDSTDHIIKNIRMKYRCWKCWHSPMLHAIYLAVVFSYDMYLEVKEVEISQIWKDNNNVYLWSFFVYFPIK